MKKIIMIALAVIMVSGISLKAEVIWSESFETDGHSTRYTASSSGGFNDGTSDHFNRTDGSDIANISGDYSNIDGSYFWAAEDTDDNGGDLAKEQSITFMAITTENYTSLNFSGYFGAGNESAPGASAYDAADYVKVQYSTDGGSSYNEGIWFSYENHGDAFNEPIALDANHDGEADGTDGSNRLGTSLVQYGFSIPGSPSSVIIKILVYMDAENEEVGFDNFVLTGTDTSLPVELSVFKSAYNHGFVKLYWLTDSEIENQGFIIERALRQAQGPVAWTEIANFGKNPDLLGQGSTTEKTDYSYIDKMVKVGETYSYRLSDVDYRGNITTHPAITVTVLAKDEDLKPGKLDMHPAYPNPFNPDVKLSFELNEAVQALALEIYDLNGALIQTVTSGAHDAGSYDFTWRGQDAAGNLLPSGVYLVRLAGAGEVQIQRITLLR